MTMKADDGAKAFLLGRIHPAIWVSCLGYLAPVAGMVILKAGGRGSEMRTFGLAFLSAAALLIAGAFVALRRMKVQRKAHPVGPHYAGRLVALINIAMGVGAFILFIAIPKGHGSSGTAQAAATATMRSLVAAQEQFRAQAVVNTDNDDAGEYGFLGELASVDPLRSGVATTVGHPLTSVQLGKRHAGTAFGLKGGYLFAIFLPSAEHGTVTAPTTQGSAPAVKADADLQERHWIAYAWPERFGATGRHAYCINEQGALLVYRNTDGRYNGPSKAPAADAVFAADGPPGLTGPLGPSSGAPDAASRSRDGAAWFMADN
jgi:hypothetical protein